jgi:quaternary ammonium compound-resistance protein SugE
MAWVLLIIAGLLEIAWAVGLKFTEGFTRLVPSLLTGAALVVSIALLGFATKTIPIGTAYAVWVGIGALGASILGMLLFAEPASAPRILFLALLLVSIVGLKLSSGH